jgi:hypothetical protein
MVNVPNLQALDIEAVRSEEMPSSSSLAPVKRLHCAWKICAFIRQPSDITAPLTNHKVRALELDDIEIAPEDIARLGEHPTLMRLTIDGGYYNLHRPEIAR